MNAEPAMTVLRNGKDVPSGAVVPVMLSLKSLCEGNPVALFELVELARDPAHRLFGNTAQVLAELGLLELGGTLHDVTRDVVLAAADGEGADLRLVSPYTPEHASGSGHDRA